jgi:hypothetical protein
MEARLLQIQSLSIVLLMLAGIFVRRRRSLHVKIMSVAMVWDIILILQIELSRSAILKASAAMTNTLALNIHVTIAISTVVLYAFMVYTGRKLLAGQNERILTFVTSFWAVVPKE